MASENQILANQRNSRLSCGPTTAQGRLVSAQNARKHGLRAWWTRCCGMRGSRMRSGNRNGLRA